VVKTGPVESLEELAKDLGQLETFDARAFVADGDEQDVCNFVLALALIHADYRNLIVAYALLEADQPADVSLINRRNGEWSGIRIHLIRQHAALVHSLLDLIGDEKSQPVIASDTFQEVLRRLDRQARECWNGLILVSQNKPSEDAFVKSIMFLRHKVASHYDPKEIFRGYERAFLGAGAAADPRRRPYVSRGNTLRNTRYYFADAAATAYLNSRVGDGQDLFDFFKQTADTLQNLNIALAQIVEKFVNIRGFAWHSEPEKFTLDLPATPATGAPAPRRAAGDTAPTSSTRRKRARKRRRGRR
jgi:hypothetical protein